MSIFLEVAPTMLQRFSIQVVRQTDLQEKALANAQREMENYRKCGDRCGEVPPAIHPLQGGAS